MCNQNNPANAAIIPGFGSSNYFVMGRSRTPDSQSRATGKNALPGSAIGHHPIPSNARYPAENELRLYRWAHAGTQIIAESSVSIHCREDKMAGLAIVKNRGFAPIPRLTNGIKRPAGLLRPCHRL
jgi:hypothetical protein